VKLVPLALAVSLLASPSTKDVLRRWVDAAGGKSALKGVADARVANDDVESGVSGRVEEWISRDGYRREAVQDADRHVEVCSGKCGEETLRLDAVVKLVSLDD
jgi:hypothetical protein